MEKTISSGMHELMVLQRTNTAKNLEKNFLDNGLDIRVSLGGRYKDRLTLTYVLMSRPLAHQITQQSSRGEGTVLGNLERVGFKAVTFSDGYNESWSYNLDPTDESQGGLLVLKEHGLAEPLRLPSP